MAAMYGRIGAYGERTCGCCDVGKDKRAQRRLEREQWVRDFRDESTHEDPTYPPGYDHYNEGGEAYPENVADIPRVAFIPAG